MDMDEYGYLDRLAIEAGTDKSSKGHNYTKVYAHYLNFFKDKPIKFLEIGILFGQSVKLWEKYFQNAELHFIDIDSKQIQYHSERSTYHFLDQGDKAQLQTFIESNSNFDVIIDDGGHYMDQQINSFIILFQALNSGGIYIIEDLHTSYWKKFGGGGDFENPVSSPESTIEFLKSLIDDLNYIGARTGISDFEQVPLSILSTLNYFQENILSMHFYDSLCIIIKR